MKSTLINRAIININRIAFRIRGRHYIREKILSCNIGSIHVYQPVLIYPFGGKYIIGDHVQFGYDIGGLYRSGYCELQARTNESVIEIGEFTAISNNFLAIAMKKITIGCHSRIGINCQIMDFDAHNTNPNLRDRPGKIDEVVIGDNVWIGNNVIILAGVHIGDNTIIGAGAVITHDMPENVICGGIPCQIIKKLGNNDFRKELLS